MNSHARVRFIAVLACIVFCLMPSGTHAATSAVTNADMVQSLQNHYYGVSGFESITGLIDKDGDKEIYATTGASTTSTFRIGSQSKMFTSTVILNLISEKSLSLDSTLNSLIADPNIEPAQRVGLQKILDQIPVSQRDLVGSTTVRQLLNMGSDIPNYLGYAPDGSAKTLWEQWQAVNYGQVPGFSYTDIAAHLNLVGLAGQGVPAPPPGASFTGTYSNSNTVILALMAEALTDESFDAQLTELLAARGYDKTYLQMTPGDAGMVGTEAGKLVTDMDPTIPWTSGAMITNMEQLLDFLYDVTQNLDGYLSPELFAARTDPANSNVIGMGGMPILYGLGLMSLDLQMINSLLSPIISVGHGGAVAGSSSFSGWLSSTDLTTNLDTGLSVYVNTLTSIDKGGFYTATPAEIRFTSMMEHLYRNARANGDNDGFGVYTYESGGGYITQEQYTGAANLVFRASTYPYRPGFVGYLDLTRLSPVYTDRYSPIVITPDPVYSYYSSVTNGDSETALNASGTVDLADPMLRLEGYGGPKNGSDTFTLLSMTNMIGQDNSILNGQIAAYGENAIAVRLDNRTGTTFGPASLLSTQGIGGAALWVGGNSTPVINGRLAAFGSGVAGYYGKGAGSKGTLAAGGSIHAVANGFSMDSDFESIDVPAQNGVFGADLAAGAQLTVQGSITAEAYHPWDGTPITSGNYITDPQCMPGVLATGVRASDGATAIVDGGTVAATGYGVWLSNGSSTLLLQNRGLVAGTLYSVYADSSGHTVDVQNSTLLGSVFFDPATAGSSLNADSGSAIYGSTPLNPIIYGVTNLYLNGTTLGFQYLAPQTGPLLLLDGFGTEPLTEVNPNVVLDQRGTYTFTLDWSQTGRLLATTTGFSNKFGMNARRMFEAMAEFSVGKNQMEMAAYAADADNLTAEGYATQYLVALNRHRMTHETARNLFARDQGAFGPTGLVSPGQLALGLSPEKALGRGLLQSSFKTGSADYIGQLEAGTRARRLESTLAGLYDQVANAAASQSILDAWSPAQKENSGFLQPGGATAALHAAHSGGLMGVRYFGGYLRDMSTRDNGGGYFGYDTENDGLLMGAAVDLNARWTMGGYVGWSKSRTNYNDIHARVDTDNFYVGLLARHTLPLAEEMKIRTTGNLSYSHMDNDENRNVGVGPVAHISGNFEQDVFGLSLELALDWMPPDLGGTVITPFVQGEYIHARQQGLRENDALALHVGGENADSLFTSIGLALGKDFALSETALLTPRASAAWQHQFGDARFSTTGNFSGYNTQFRVNSLKQERQSALLGLSLDAVFKGEEGRVFGLKAGYGAGLRSDGTDQQLYLGTEYRF